MTHQRKHIRRSIRGKIFVAGKKSVKFHMREFVDRGVLKREGFVWEEGKGGKGKIIPIMKIKEVEK